MKPILMRAFLALSLLLIHSATAWGYKTCSPDYDAWGWLDASQTMDNEIMDLWCAGPEAQAQATFNYYWDALNLHKPPAFWFQQAALEGGVCGNANRHIVRLANTANVMDAVYASSRDNQTIDQSDWAYAWLGWLVAPRSKHGYVTDSCSCCDIVASNPTNKDPTKLKYVFFWQRTAPGRTSTLVHEAVHDWQGHLADSSCPAGGSCDGYFGASNAQTFQIRFFEHAAAVYRLDPMTNEALVARYSEEICGYMPYLSPAARWEAYAHGFSKWTNNFAYPQASEPFPDFLNIAPTNDPFWDYGGATYIADQAMGARWGCGQLCEPSDYLPSGKAFCNEDYQPENADRNQYNFDICVQANSEIAPGVTSKQWHDAKMSLQYRLRDCLPGLSEDYLTDYCHSLRIAAANVAALENAWDLPDDAGYFDSDRALRYCTRKYCEKKFKLAWVDSARAQCYAWSDPQSTYGCLDALCGSLTAIAAGPGKTSRAYFDAVQCRRHYLEHAGNTDAYFDPEQSKRPCDSVYVDCVNNQAYAAWVAGQAAGPPSCTLTTGGTEDGYHPADSAWYQIASLASVSSLSFEAWQAAFPGAQLGECEAAVVTCEALHAELRRMMAELLAVAQTRFPIPDELNLPRSPDDEWRPNVLERSLGKLSDIAVSSPEDSLGFSSKGAIAQLGTVPELMQAMAWSAGRETFFAVHGVKGMAPIFGEALTEAFVDAEIRAPRGDASAGEVAALAALAEGKTMRERTESAATAELFAAAGTAEFQLALFTFLNDLGSAESLAEIGTALDTLAAAVP